MPAYKTSPFFNLLINAFNVCVHIVLFLAKSFIKQSLWQILDINTFLSPQSFLVYGSSVFLKLFSVDSRLLVPT